MTDAGLLSFESAREQVLRDLPTLSPERIPASECVGRVLAEDLSARRPMPAFDHSAMDGYALHSSNGALNTLLKLSGESRTGGDLPTEVAPGTACRIFTGARMPAGADAVLMQEYATPEGDSVRLGRAVRAGDHVRHTGDDVAAGATVLARGTRLTPFHIALLSALENTRVTVSRRPIVSIVSTGDELRESGSEDFAGSVVDANGPGLSAIARACGAEVRVLPFARDDMAATRHALERALEASDVVLTVGGVSVGEHDLVRAAMTDVGVSLDFWRVAIKPGKPLAFGRTSRGQRILALPGNPSSAMLTFVLFGAPMLRALQGDTEALAPTVRAKLSRAVRHSPGRLEFMRGRLNERAVPATMELLSNQSSGSVSSFAWANALAMIPLESDGLPEGAEVSCMRLADV